jgi:LysM domain
VGRQAWLSVAVAAVFGAMPALAQAPTDVVREGWHVVRPGETLWVLAKRYLGDDEAWPVLYALNPEIANPHHISPGQRVRVQVTGDYVTDVAQVTKVSRRVEGQLTPNPWQPSIELDLLNPHDGVRTFEASSSELLFSDASRLVLSEDSLVFIGRAGTYQRRVRRDEIEIVVGQADLDAGATARDRDLILGAGRLHPGPGGDGHSQARLRRPADGGAQIMIYSGEGSVESGGATQEVASGMGTQMREGEAPAPPETLLAAPAPRVPAAGSEWFRGDPRFEWEAVAGAAAYVVEVCRDSECGRLVARRRTTASDGVSTIALEAGEYHWRVTAVSASGLDGYPSAATPFTIRSAAADRQPPDIRAAFSGPQIERAGTLYVGSGSRLEIEASDAASGVERAWAEVDGVETELEATAPWSLPSEDWAEGRHLVVVKAVDRAGNAGREDVSFVYDTTGPEIHWGPEGGGVYHSFVGEPAATGDPGGGRRGHLPALRWSPDGATWQATGTQRWRVERGEAPRFFLRPRGLGRRLYVLPGVSMRLGRRAGAGVLVVDPGVGTEALEFQVETVGGGPRLVVESTDRLGNRSRVEWPLARGRKRH